MEIIQRPKGTNDVYDETGRTILYIRDLVESIAKEYNYNYFRTPTFERTEVFKRGVGDTTDIVEKETYDFVDRGNRNMTLRPEGTAAVVRSIIENKLYVNGINKVWYFMPMFRYERPQSGRLREHFQFGFESFGTNSPYADAEIISIAVKILKGLGLKGIKVNINSLGDIESRNNYREALKEHFRPHLDNLCSDCKERFDRNPLRIIDCKVDSELEVIKNAPKILDYLNDESKKYFESVKKNLDILGIEYNVNPNIVRGLDYYTHTVFEITAEIKDFGSQNVLCGGGRYNNLVSNLGGPEYPSVGFGMGIERLMNALSAEGIDFGKKEIDAYICYISDNEKDYAFKLLNELRNNNLRSDMCYTNRNLKGQFKECDSNNTKFVIIIGEEEKNTEVITIKNNNTKKEYKINRNELVEFIRRNYE
ncbi:MAG: histidine--tRNA ligase [Bacilli bacterium]|nr:histidine--tRNA ligase [Bacilli bacterium]